MAAPRSRLRPVPWNPVIRSHNLFRCFKISPCEKKLLRG
jgi:hypothetical protein